MIVFHIGLKKAGSSSIQAFLSDNEHILRQLGIDYAQIGRWKWPGHRNLAREIVKGLGKFDPAHGTISELSDYWRSAPGTTLVVSSEAFEEAEVEEIAVIRDAMFRARPSEEIRIVLILRDLLDLMPSSYAQRAKTGTIQYDFDVFFELRMRERRVNYFETAKRWADVFGWESIRLRLLDRNHLVNGDLLTDFMVICELGPMVTAGSLIKRSLVSNAAPGWRVLEALRALFNGCHGLPPEHVLSTKKTGKHRRKLGKLAIAAGQGRGWNEDRGLYLTAEQADRCCEVYSANVCALNARLSSPLPAPQDLTARGFRAREFLPGVGHIAPDELFAFYENMASQMSEQRARSRDK